MKSRRRKDGQLADEQIAARQTGFNCGPRRNRVKASFGCGHTGNSPLVWSLPHGFRFVATGSTLRFASRPGNRKNPSSSSPIPVRAGTPCGRTHRRICFDGIPPAAGLGAPCCRWRRSRESLFSGAAAFFGSVGCEFSCWAKLAVAITRSAQTRRSRNFIMAPWFVVDVFGRLLAQPAVTGAQSAAFLRPEN